MEVNGSFHNLVHFSPKKILPGGSQSLFYLRREEKSLVPVGDLIPVPLQSIL
jgi:hypothetical protein